MSSAAMIVFLAFQLATGRLPCCLDPASWSAASATASVAELLQSHRPKPAKVHLRRMEELLIFDLG